MSLVTGTSIAMQDSKSDVATSNVTLCFIILTCITGGRTFKVKSVSRLSLTLPKFLWGQSNFSSFSRFWDTDDFS